MTGTFGSLNKGDAARVRAFVSSMERFFPKAKFSLLSYDVKTDTDTYKNFINVIDRPWGKKWGKLNRLGVLLNYFYLLFSALLFRVRKKTKVGGLSSFDIFIDLSGESLSDYFGQRALIAYFYPIVLALLMEKKVIICSQSIGPLNNAVTRNIAKFVLIKADLVLVRDDWSLNYIRKHALVKSNSFLTADPAFVLKPISQIRVLEIFAKERITIYHPLIGVSIGYGSFKGTFGLHSERGLEQDREALTETIIRMIDAVEEKYGTMVLLIPHVISPVENDLKVLTFIHSKVKNKDKTRIISGNYDPAELKALIGQCDVIVSSRMHPVIHAATMGTIPISIAYSVKMPSLMQSLGLPEYSLSVTDLTFENLMMTIQDALKNKVSLRKKLLVNVNILKKRAYANCEHIYDHINGNIALKSDLMKEISETEIKYSEIKWSSDIAQYYDYFYGEMDAHLSKYLTQRFLKISLSSSDYCLDLGCGTGKCTSHLFETSDCQIVGLDISRALIEIAKKNLDSDRVNFIVADAENMPFKDVTFRSVFCWFALHHIPNKNLCFEEINRVLNNESTFLAIEQGDRNLNTGNSHFNYVFEKIPYMLRLSHRTVLIITNPSIRKMEAVWNRQDQNHASPHEKPLPSHLTFHQLQPFFKSSTSNICFVLTSTYKQKPWLINRYGFGDIFVITTHKRIKKANIINKACVADQ